MALNPPILPGGLPMGIVGEVFCLEREGIDFELSGSLPSKLKASGRLYLTTVRICFVPNHPTPAFSGIDIPLQGISKESFEQPWFGANYLKGDVAPVPGRGLAAPGTWKMHFMRGGCTRFLSYFFAIMERWRIADESARRAFFDNERRMQDFVVEAQTAFVDPTDPSIIYVTQPAAVQTAARIPRAEWYPTPVGVAGHAPAPAPGGYAGFGGAPPAPAPAAAMPPYGGPAAAYGGAGGYAPSAGPAGYPPAPAGYAAGPAPGYAPGPAPGYGPGAAPGYAPAPGGYGPPPGIAPGAYAYGAPAPGAVPAGYAPAHAGGAAGTTVVATAATAVPRFF